MTEKSKIDSCGNISVKKIVILKIIDDSVGQKEIWVGDLSHKISKLASVKKMQFGLNYKENSLYKILDRMAQQKLIKKYKVVEPHLYSYVKITQFGFDVLQNFGNFLGKNKNKKS